MSESNLEIPMVDIEDLADQTGPIVVDAEQTAPIVIETEKIAPSVMETEEQPKKRPGRLVGAKSREPGKPRAPRKKRVEIVEEEEVVEQPRVLPGSRPIPTQSHNDTTAMMLQLLQHQAHRRQRNKEDLWKS